MTRVLPDFTPMAHQLAPYRNYIGLLFSQPNPL